MAGMEAEDFEWELSKENVRPLRRGREMSSLSAALHSDSDHDTDHQIKAKQNEFELELRTYCGLDPFDVWDRYIKWTEQYFPKGGHDGHLMCLIERCLKEFQSNDIYKADPRFIRTWITFASACEDPVEIFHHMFDNGIGLNVADLYIEWAQCLERQGDNKKADAIYTEGLNRMAQPQPLLRQRHQQFESRLARNITLQISDRQNPGMDMGEEEKRLVLGRLQGSRQTQKVGSMRTGNVIKGTAGSLKVTTQDVKKQVPGSKIRIFEDENAPLPIHLQQTNEWKSLPTRETDNRENDKKAGVWTSAKMKQKVPAAPALVGAPFEIHTDPDPDPYQQTPRKTTLVNSQPLSSHKPSSFKDYGLSSLRPEQANSGKPMYQKHKVYQGLMEFSFEELRAAKYWKNRQKKEEEKEKEALRKQVELMNQKIATMAEKMEALLQQGQSSGSHNIPSSATDNVSPSGQCHTQQVAGDQHSSPSSISENCDQEMTETRSGVTSSGNRVTSSDNTSMITPTNANGFLPGSGSSQNASLNGSGRTPIFNSMSTYSTISSGGSTKSNSFSLNVSHRSNVSLSQAGLKSTQNMPNSSNILSSAQAAPFQIGNVSSSQTPPQEQESIHESSLNTSSFAEQRRANSTITPKSSSIMSPESTSSLTKRGLTAPSPTVMTKAALQAVHQMFYRSMNETTSSEDTKAFQNPPGNVAASAIPFQICEDPTTQVTQPCDSRGGLQVFCDKQEEQENRMTTSDSDARSSRGLQIHCDEPQDCVDQENMRRHGLMSTAKPSQGLQIHCDEPGSIADQENYNPSSRKRKGLQIYQDTGFQDQENMHQSETMKPAVRRGLGFTPCQQPSEDVEMSAIDRELACEDFTIECQARDDMTLAALDSFSVLARASSTPFAPAKHTDQSNTSEDVNSINNIAGEKSSFGQNYGTQNLSPIEEQSEGSDESKSSTYNQSSHASNATARSRCGSTKSLIQEPIAEELPEEEADVGDSSMLDAEQLDATCHHQIDTSAYIHPVDSKESALSTSIMVNPHNPFDDKCIAKFLETMNPPLSSYPNYISFSEPAPEVNIGQRVLCLGERYVTLESKLGEGGYAKIYKIFEQDFDFDISSEFDNDVTTQIASASVLKVQSPACLWEFYVSSELHKRLGRLSAQFDVKPSVMKIQSGYFYTNASFLEMKYLPQGSLLDLVNLYKADRNLLSGVEPFACLLTIELLHMFEQIHLCKFIHGDVKPDNFLLMDLHEVRESGKSPQLVFGRQSGLVNLIDFGQSIDMTKFPDGTSFTASVKTSGFQCIEMKTDRPWTYQTDLYGVAGTVHVVLFGMYMNIFQEQGTWRTTGAFNRKWNVQLWKEFFHVLLNIPSCDELPDLASMRHKFEEYFLTQTSSYNSWVSSVHRRKHLMSDR